MKPLKDFLRKIDIFGIPLNFKYKTKDKYSTPFGGFILLLFCILALAFGIYYLIPFLNRKNLSIIYYTMNIPETERISLKESKAAFSIGLDCEDKTEIKANDIFKLDINYVLYIKNMSGHYNKNKTFLSSHNCRYEDFYNNYNTSFQYLNLKKYRCLDDYDHNIEGIFSDQIFSYYEFSLTAKTTTDVIEKYLMANDCKLQMYYTDITIDLYNYEEPIKPFLNSLFIQLNPTLFIKRNIFFMNQYLYDDDALLAVFDEEQKPKQMKTLFSRYEEYSLYLGLDREKTKPLSVIDYAKVYIRADTKKTDIRRTYQKLTEFFADASSLLIAIYDCLIIIMSFINNFYAEQTIMKKLFIFKGLDNNNSPFSKKPEKIQRLTTLGRKKIVKNIKQKNEIIENNDIHFNTNVESIKNENKDISQKELITTDNYEKKIKLKKFRKNKTNKTNKETKKSKNIFTTTNIEDENIEDSGTSKRQIKNIRSVLNLKANQMNEDINNINNINTLEKEENQNKIKDDILKQKESKLSFNIFEIICILIFPCCLRGQLKLKNFINEKALNILNSKLDIILYVRNMILFDIINKTILDESKRDIINFLSRPILSLNKNSFEEKDMFYENYKENDLDKFYESYLELAKKPNKKDKEKKLLSLSQKQLNDLF